MIAALRRDVVDSFEEIDVARERRERRGAKVRDACDIDCRPDFIVDRRIQTAVRVLKARFVQRAAAESGDIADYDRLIGVTQTGAAADGVQSADVARIDGVDVIETVATR